MLSTEFIKRYNTYHQILLSNHKRRNTNVYQELRNGGFTISIKDGRFNCVHGDYICERQNGEKKRSGGPIKGVLSNSTTTYNTWLRTRRIGAEMQKQVKERMNLNPHPSVFVNTQKT